MGDGAARLYAKGLTVERFGFGIAAFAYYRRVAEDIIERLMSDLRGFAEGIGSDDLVRAVDAVANEQQASKRIAAVKDLVPPILKPKGQLDPLGTIYGALSANLHTGSDEECIELAAKLRLALEFVVPFLALHTRSPKGYAEALDRLGEAAGKKR